MKSFIEFFPSKKKKGENTEKRAPKIWNGDFKLESEESEKLEPLRSPEPFPTARGRKSLLFLRINLSLLKDSIMISLCNRMSILLEPQPHYSSWFPSIRGHPSVPLGDKPKSNPR